MRKRLSALFAVLALVLFVTTSTVAQTETGQILGTVTDQSGGAVAKAKVSIKNVGTGAERTTMTDDNGQYTVTNLLPALYEVTVERQGFAKNVRRVQVTVGSKVAQDIQLSVGATQVVVEVTAEAGVAVNTETQTLATVIDSKKITELPTLTRNPYDLAATAGNVTSASESGLSNRGVNLNINGLRAAGTNVLLDGAANNDEFVASVGQQIPLDAVQEFSILTTNYTAEYGRAGAGVVNVATKSGTNSLHGTAYEFGRYSKLAANSFENNANNLPKSLFTRNQFGYSVGGPIKKDKLFFFQSTEWLRVRSSFNRIVAVPAADLINAAAPATRNFMTLGTLRSNFRPIRSYTRAQLAAGGQDPCPSGGACAALPASANYFTQGSYTVPSDAGGGDPQNTYFLVGRIDLNISNKTSLYGRYAYNNAQRQSGVNTNSPYQGYDTAAQDHDSNFLISLVHQVSPRWTTQSKLVFNRLNNQQPLGANPVGPTLYMLSGTPQRIQGDRLAFPGYSPFTPGNAVPFGGPQNFLQAYEDVSYAKGKHHFRFGGNYVYIRDNRTFGAYQEAVETLTLGGFDAGINNFLTGQLDQFQAAVDPQGKFPCGATTTPQCSVTLPVGPPSFSRSNRYHEFGVYSQDSWKVASRVTLNLGVRWEYFGVQHNKNPRLDSNYYDAVGGSVFQGIRNGDVAIAPNSPIGGLWRKQYNNFAPRLGFAWDVFGNGKTSLRGGYGIAYDRNFGNVTFNVIQNPPAYAVISILPSDIGAPIPITANNAGPLAGSGPSKGLPPVSLRNVDTNIRTAYAHFWSLSVEREVGRNLFVGIDYSGSKGHGLYTLENPNRPGAGNVYLGDCFTGPGCGATRLRATQYTNINRRGANGFSLYNGANFRVETRSLGTTGLTLRANYTYAHATDNLSSTFSESDNNFNLGLLDPFNPKLDRGPADFDVRHRFALSATWDLPFARNASSGVAKKVLGGWTVSPIFTARTGTPFTLFDCLGRLTICRRAMTSGSLPSAFGVDNVPSVASGIPIPNSFDYISLPGSTFNRGYRNPIVNASDFGPFPATMMSRNYFRTPGTWSVDVGIYKTTAITERFKLQVRGEMFNTFNHSNLWAVLGDNTISGTGALVHGKKGLRPDGTKENRNVQLAVKLIF